MIKAVASVLVVGFVIAGCARFHPQAEAPQPLTGERLKELSLTGPDVKADILYLLLSAELAGQKGRYPLALQYYLQVADKVPDAWVAERAARIALYLQDYDKADQAVKLWLERAPDSPAAHLAALQLALQRNRIEAAVSHFARLLQLTPEAKRSAVLLDILRFMDRKVSKDTALAVMAQVSRRFADSPEVLYAHALLALHHGKIRLALDQVTRALALRPDWEKLHVLQSRLLIQLGETGKARQVLAELVRKHPDNLQLRLLYAQLLLKQEAFAEAEKQLRRILRRQPDHPDALYAYALVNLRKGDDAEARKALMRLLKQPKWRSEAYYYLGRIAQQHRKVEEAVRWFDKIESGSLVFDARLNAALALAQSGRIDEALKRLERLADRYPQRRLQIYLIRAEILTRAQKYQAAFETLSEALADFPADPDLLYARALVAEQMGNPHQAIVDLRAALEKRPDDPHILNALGYTLLEYGGSLEEARELLEKAIRLKPDDAAVLDSYGWLQFKLGKVSEALTYLQRAYAKAPDLEIAYHLGEVYWALKRYDKAREIWLRGFEEGKGDPRWQKFFQKVRDRLNP